MATETLRRRHRQAPAGGRSRGATPSGGSRKNKLAMVGLILVGFVTFIAIFGSILAPYNYQDQDLAAVVANKRPAAAAAERRPHPRHRPDRA